MGGVYHYEQVQFDGQLKFDIFSLHWWTFLTMRWTFVAGPASVILSLRVGGLFSVRKVRRIPVGFSPCKPQKAEAYSPARHIPKPRKDRTSVLSFFLDCRRNNQHTKTDRFTERSAIKNKCNSWRYRQQLVS